MLALDKQDWFLRVFQKTKIIFINGRADADHLQDAVIRRPDFQAHARAK